MQENNRSPPAPTFRTDGGLIFTQRHFQLDGNIDPAITGQPPPPGQAPPQTFRYDPQLGQLAVGPDGFAVATSPIPEHTSDHSGDSEGWNATYPQQQSDQVKSRKPRREKPRIELASDQPPTTQGKPRARVYVACQQCRNRKIRCDGAKPVCHNCSRRANPSNECCYDAVPKRRGPDKVPGARQRMARDQKQIGPDGAEYSPNTPRRRRKSQQSPVTPGMTQFPDGLNGARQIPGTAPWPAPTGNEPAHLPEDFMSGPPPTTARMVPPGSFPQQPMFQGQEQQMQGTPVYPRRVDDFSYTYTYTPYSYHPPLPSSSFDPSTSSGFPGSMSTHQYPYADDGQVPRIARRSSVRLIRPPSLDFSRQTCSEIGLGDEGRTRAEIFRIEAQNSLEASLNAGWIDLQLAQSAWILAFFEVCSHPLHSSTRCSSSMRILDSVIRALSLTVVDSGDATTSTFPPWAPSPRYPSISPTSASSSTLSSLSPLSPFTRPSTGSSHSPSLKGCSCSSHTLGEMWPQAGQHVPFWESTPAWPDETSVAEIQKESCRRLCWSVLILTAGRMSYFSSVNSTVPDLFCGNPLNYNLLFSGEALLRSSIGDPVTSKHTVWSLYDQIFLLWSGCIRMRCNRTASEADKAHFAVKAWLEAGKLETELNRHTCALERAFIFQGREYIFNTRMCISHEFRRYIPQVTTEMDSLFDRTKAEEWLVHQKTVADRLVDSYGDVTGYVGLILARRPFFVFWFMEQICRALTLWQQDRTLTVALDACEALLRPTDYLTILWPSDEQRRRYADIRERLENACASAGRTPPSPLNLTLRSISESPTP